MASIVLHLAIAGHVQGVGYRRWAAREAERRGLGGWVRNRPDGTVEAVAAGERAAVEAFVAACREGPRGARVESVAATPGGAAPGPGFSVLPTG